MARGEVIPPVIKERKRCAALVRDYWERIEANMAKRPWGLEYHRVANTIIRELKAIEREITYGGEKTKGAEFTAEEIEKAAKIIADHNNPFLEPDQD